jgi:serine/threonine protein phosphatase PrpC
LGVWIGVSLLVVLVLWAAVRGSTRVRMTLLNLLTEESPRGTPSPPGPGRGKREPRQRPETRRSRRKAAEAALPRMNDEDDDAVEVTVVTASPVSRRPPAEAGASEPPPSEAPDEPSKIDVTYEDEADIEEITSPVARILISAEGQSDGGKVRRRNEDSFLVLEERSLFVVADGMGGYAGGDVASALAVDTLGRAFEAGTFEGKTESDQSVPRRGREMACAILMANQAILTRATGDPSLVNMGTTVVAARFSPNKQRVYIGHVGDSRCYRLRREVLKQLTNDHTFMGLGLKGPGAHHLYQAVGVKPRITIDIVVDKPQTDDIYLLCTDGLTKMAGDDQIRDILLDEPDLEAAVYSLIELANDRGGRDNVTVVLVKVLERIPRPA